MSFSRAKRFNYKNPDLQVSPADYYISSTLEKTCMISKCPRFGRKSEEASTSSTCSRLNCRCSDSNGDSGKFSRSAYRNSPNQSSTPFSTRGNSNSTDFNKIKNKIIKLNEEYLRRNSINNSSESKLGVKDLVNKYENLHPNKPCSCRSMDLNDDDYYSYTSSNDSDMVNFDNISKGSTDRKIFERIVIEKMDKIKKNIEQFQKQLFGLEEKLTDPVTLQKYTKNSHSQINFHQEDIKFIISTKIENLRKEFETRQNSILSRTIEKIKNLAKEIYTTQKESTLQIKETCDNTASDLYKEIMEYIEKNDTLELEPTKNLELGDGFFNYENICGVLSNILQDSQKELEDLKKKKMDITVKCGTHREQLKTQTSIIEMLNEDIEELKNDF